jgi:hypothetical protein
MIAFGPWQGEGVPHSGNLAQPARPHPVFSDGNAYLAGGQTSQGEHASFPGEWPDPAYTPGSGNVHTEIARFSFPDRWTGTVCVSGPAWPGLAPYEPFAELAASPSAIGWQHDGAPDDVYYLHHAACVANGAEDVWDAWNDGGGWTRYTLWRERQHDPLTSGELRVSVTSASGGPLGLTFTAGTPAAIYYASDRVYVADVLASVTGATLATSPGDSTVALPSTTAVSGYGSCLLPAFKVADIPPSAWGGVDDSSGVYTGTCRCWGTAPSRAWRLIQAAAVVTVIPLRQSRRTDGLVGAGRQQRPTLRQGRVSGPAVIRGGV